MCSALWLCYVDVAFVMSQVLRATEFQEYRDVGILMVQDIPGVGPLIQMHDLDFQKEAQYELSMAYRFWGHTV